ncbi:MAG: hypothetical protein K2W97_01930 [Chthoniobacterales bacterium]|nr:hypothetical protein [Chthoniobacterales bacterium]
MIKPSAEWQHWIFIAALAWLLFEMWRGWRLGMIRGMVKIFLLIAAWIGASAAAAATSAALAVFFRTPSTAIPTAIAALVGLTIYFFGTLLAGFLLKRTEHHHGLFQTIFGIGGACCGLLFGLFFLWGGISLVRSLGLFGEMRLMEAQRKGCPLKDESFACNLVRLERSLEMGPMGQFLISTDPLSPAFYENTRKSMKVMQDPEAFQRFLQSPNVERLLMNPRLNHVLNNRELQDEIKIGNIPAVFHDPDIQALLHDPQVMKELKQFDLSQAVDYALKKK